MRLGEVRQICKLDAAMGQMNLSARGYRRVLKLVRMIADLAGGEQVHAVHLAEALQHRPKVMTGQITRNYPH